MQTNITKEIATESGWYSLKSTKISTNQSKKDSKTSPLLESEDQFLQKLWFSNLSISCIDHIYYFLPERCGEEVILSWL